MKDLPPRPQPPLPLLTLPREQIVLQAADAQREAPDGDRRQIVRARSVRRRLFADEEPAGPDGGTNGEVGRRRRRMLWPGARPEEPAVAHLARRVQDSLDKMLADEAAAASRRWNFDFENERPLEGQWQWEKVEDLADSLANENCVDEQALPVDDCQSPQR